MIRNRIVKIIRPVREIAYYLQLPDIAKVERRGDSLGLPSQDPGIEKVIDEGVAWLGRAQDNSTSADGGVSRHYSLVTGWVASYPETTGYIIPTMLEHAKLSGDNNARIRAKRMLDWLVDIQLPCGGFQGGIIGSTPVIPVTFNTGQILIGLSCGFREFGGQYHDAMCRAADWLVETQDHDGCWRSHSTPFAKPGEKSYETHVAWGLLEAARIEQNKPYAEAALSNVRWALLWQRDNGWFDKCCLTDPTQPLSHTLGYVLRGIVETFRFTKDKSFLQASRKAADGLLLAIQDDGFLPGRIGQDWNGTVGWACLTGSVQIAHCWLMLYQDTGDVRYRDAAYAANRYVRRTVKFDERLETRGAVKGSFPVQGGYNRYLYLNWACKFLVDANMLEKKVRDAEKSCSSSVTKTKT